ncbi:hypothetical protein IMSHALPRED_002423 [Imshaugia aleurites]|uniref:Uncharacterized protein n=1 Tax=Imshaugia aleurites TaxID=172621 RepID=A0A8H3J5N0_9LECA|nr:hypothetical protein IMSHALPRED_002423 [Imshaugia aleurites]
MLHRLLLSFLALTPALTPLTSALVPQTPATISNPVLPNTNGTVNSNPRRRGIRIDDTHTIYFTEYRALVPARNYFAAIIAMQTSMIMEYFERRAETVRAGSEVFDVYGVHIYLDNPTGQLTYELAHRMLGELGEFLMEGGYCTARFGLWGNQGAAVRQLSEGWIIPEYTGNATA